MCSLKTFVGRNKTVLAVLCLFYIFLGYVLHFALFEHDIQVVQMGINKTVVMIEKK